MHIRVCVCAKGAGDGLFVNRAPRQKKRKSVKKKKEERAACAWRVPKKAEIHGWQGFGSAGLARLLRVRVRGGVAELAVARPDRAAVAVLRRRERRVIPPIPWGRNGECFQFAYAAKTDEWIGAWGSVRFASAFEHGGARANRVPARERMRVSWRGSHALALRGVAVQCSARCMYKPVG